MDSETALRQFLNEKQLNSLTIKKLAGSSGADVFLCQKRIFKVGSKLEYEGEITGYQRFESLPKYNLTFPWLKLLSSRDERVIWEMENCGEKNFEDILLSFRNQDQEASALAVLNRDVLDKIYYLYTSTKNLSQSDGERAKVFFENLVETLRINLGKAGLLNTETQKKLKKIKRNQQLFTFNFVAAWAHNDLTVGNIIVDNHLRSIKFIDPRASIPYFPSKMEFSNPLVDLTGYYLSVARKEMEIKKIDPNLSLRFTLNKITREILTKYRKVFSMPLKILGNVVWYSVYAACKCDYCTSPGRLWLYEKMKSELVLLLKELDKLLAG